MCRRILNIVVLLLCNLLTSCLGVFYIDLGNHYAWLEDRIIVKIKEETANSLSYDLLIRPQVLNYGYDNKFIIAYQIYDGSEWYNSNQIAEEKDSLFIQFAKLKEMKHCYWIINKETNQVIGPMRKPEFDRKCEELHVEYLYIGAGIVLLLIINRFILAPIRRLAINIMMGLFLLHLINTYGSLAGLHHVNVTPLTGLIVGFFGVPGVVAVTLFYLVI